MEIAARFFGYRQDLSGFWQMHNYERYELNVVYWSNGILAKGLSSTLAFVMSKGQ